MLYEEWLKEFIKDKTLVAIFDQSSFDDVHDVHRYKDASDVLWETAITFTGRVLARSGETDADGSTIRWTPWQTLHHVEMPK